MGGCGWERGGEDGSGEKGEGGEEEVHRGGVLRSARRERGWMDLKQKVKQMEVAAASFG